jgi:hypothetical protein
MQTPPPFQNPGMMQPPMPARSNNRLLWGIVITIVVLCCGGVIALTLFGVNAFKQAMPLAGCALKLERLQTALRSYSEGHNGMTPAAATWQDDLAPELEKIKKSNRGKDDEDAARMFGIDSEPFSCTVTDQPNTGLWYNSDIAGKKLADIKATDTVAFFEKPEATKNGAEPYKEVTAESPKFKMLWINQSRGWFVAPIMGEVDLIKNGKRVPINTKRSFSTTREN